MTETPRPTAWHCKFGQWTEGDDPISEEWSDHEDMNTVMRRLGYELDRRAGTNHAYIEMWSRPQTAPRHVIVMAADSVHYVYADALPDALDLLARWTPIIRDEEILVVLGDDYEECTIPTGGRPRTLYRRKCSEKAEEAE